MQGDIDLRGNLATWNSGLREWVHLPWHPEEDPTDFNGVYTLRLVVEGKDGKTVEDRVTCEVGRVIAQCLPGMALSPDKVVAMHFPEQALMSAFRVYTILPVGEVGEKAPPVPVGTKIIGEVYRVREPGDRFIKDVALEFRPAASALTSGSEGIAIHEFDVAGNRWKALPTTRNETGNVFRTTLQELPAGRALYVLMQVAGAPAPRISDPAAARPEAL